MYFGANSRCRIENSVQKAAVFLHPMYIIGLKIVPRVEVVHGVKNCQMFIVIETSPRLEIIAGGAPSQSIWSSGLKEVSNRRC